MPTMNKQTDKTRITLPPVPANRLPRADVAVNRGREVRIGLLGALGLLALVVGIPALLWIFVGYPLPTSAPSHDWLTTTINGELVIKVLACALWLVWAHFVVCIVAEWRSIRRGRLPGSVPLGGGSQFLARRLVAAALLLAGAAALVPHGGGSHAVTRASTGTGAPTHIATATLHAATQAGSGTAAVTATPTAAPASKFYVVQPPDGRRYDSLWDIAQRTLGNPLRYKEIYALNEGHVQADGRQLQDANLIRPGWQLILPSDAAGAGVQTVQTAPLAVAPSVPVAPSSPSVPSAPNAAHLGVQGGSGVGQVDVKPGAALVDAERIALGGGLLLAGLALAVSTRRGPYTAPGDDERFTSGGDPVLADLLDAELRQLAASRDAQGHPLPQPVLAYASTERIVLQLAGGDREDPPAPWQSSEDERSWTLDLVGRHIARPDYPAPFPGLVSVGRSHGFELLLDLEQAPGLVSIGGDLERAREVVTAMAVQSATSIWSDGVRVTLVGFGDGAALAEIAPGLVDHAPQLSPVLAALEAESADLGNLQRQLGVDGVLRGRQLHRSSAWRPHLVVLSGPPTAEEAARLQAVIGNGRSSFVALTVGDTHDARWRFAVDAAGTLGMGVLGATAQAHRLTREAAGDAIAAVRDLLARRAADTSAVAALSPADAVRFAPSTDEGALAVPVAASVLLLGPIMVDAAGPLDGPRRDLATEIVIAASLQREGLHDAVLRSAVWPRGVPDDVMAAAIADVQRWLGTGSDGRPRLRQDDDGLWRLAPDVRTDWDVLRSLAAQTEGPAEGALLSQALQLVRGELFSATPSGRYGWFTFSRAARDARVVITTVARRSAQLAAGHGRVAEAVVAVRAGLRAVPTSELLWRDLIALAGRSEPDAGAGVVAEIYETLAVHHIRPEPETDALVAQVVPGYQFRTA